ncbi:hypothetical protein AAMO2058_001707100 [Amorphochlora amoebiformis]
MKGGEEREGEVEEEGNEGGNEEGDDAGEQKVGKEKSEGEQSKVLDVTQAQDDHKSSPDLNPETKQTESTIDQEDHPPSKDSEPKPLDSEEPETENRDEKGNEGRSGKNMVETESKKPADFIEPTESKEPVQFTESKEPIEPTESREPIETTEPIEPSGPIEPTESTEPMKSTQTTEEADEKEREATVDLKKSEAKSIGSEIALDARNDLVHMDTEMEPMESKVHLNQNYRMDSESLDAEVERLFKQEFDITPPTQSPSLFPAPSNASVLPPPRSPDNRQSETRPHPSRQQAPSQARRGYPEPRRGKPEPRRGQPEPRRGQPEPRKGQPEPRRGQSGGKKRRNNYGGRERRKESRDLKANIDGRERSERRENWGPGDKSSTPDREIESVEKEIQNLDQRLSAIRNKAKGTEKACFDVPPKISPKPPQNGSSPTSQTSQPEKRHLFPKIRNRAGRHVDSNRAGKSGDQLLKPKVRARDRTKTVPLPTPEHSTSSTEVRRRNSKSNSRNYLKKRQPRSHKVKSTSRSPPKGRRNVLLGQGDMVLPTIEQRIGNTKMHSHQMPISDPYMMHLQQLQAIQQQVANQMRLRAQQVGALERRDERTRKMRLLHQKKNFSRADHRPRLPNPYPNRNLSRFHYHVHPNSFPQALYHPSYSKNVDPRARYRTKIKRSEDQGGQVLDQERRYDRGWLPMLTEGGGERMEYKGKDRSQIPKASDVRRHVSNERRIKRPHARRWN